MTEDSDIDASRRAQQLTPSSHTAAAAAAAVVVGLVMFTNAYQIKTKLEHHVHNADTRNHSVHTSYIAYDLCLCYDFA